MKLELQKNTPDLKQLVVPTFKKIFNFVVSTVNKWKKTKNLRTVLVNNKQ